MNLYGQKSRKRKSDSGLRKFNWPFQLERFEMPWYPANSRLIGQVRTNINNYVLPPAMVRKASWRD